MRKQFIFASIVVLALVSSTAAWAQVGGGIKAGVNLATLSDFNNASTSQRVGLTVGGFMTFGLAPMLEFEPEVLFSMQGSKLHFSTSGSIVSSDVTAKLDYIQVPLLLRIGNSGKAGASLYGVVGPSIGILARNEGVTGDIKKSDFGVVFGAGVTVSRLLMEARYTAGLTAFNAGGTSKNRVLSLLIGLTF